MKNILFILVLSLTMYSCQEDDPDLLDSCSIFATVIDKSELDGCGYILKLNDGEILIPIIRYYCGTPPLPVEITEDPLYNFQFYDGQLVKIDYEFPEESYYSTCMAGKSVIITCITDIINRDRQGF